jgi:hypothetical protein
MVNYNNDGKVNVYAIDKNDIKLPDLATPVPFESSIYMLDSCNLDPQLKVFIPDKCSYRLTNNKIHKLE